MTALTRKRRLFAVAIGFATLGIFFGLAGFLHWSTHWALMSRLLG